MSVVAAAVVAVHLLSAVGDRPPSATPKRARASEPVTLHAVVEVREKTGRVYHADVPLVVVGRRPVATRPLGELGAVTFRWYKVEPTKENLSNTETGTFAWATIPYAETEVVAWRGKARVAADVRPTLIPDRGGGVGTMRFKLEAELADGRRLATPGAEARRGAGAPGLSDRVHRVSLRRDDTYLGYLTELYGQPYIWASGGTGGAHQAERLEGADCADFVTYGWRRLGHAVPYTWTEGLRAHARRLGGGTRRPDGVYVTADGRPVPFPSVGDLVLFPRHVGVLVADRGIAGVLDEQDVMAHTLFEAPHEEAIAASGMAGQPVEILRWKGRRDPAER